MLYLLSYLPTMREELWILLHLFLQGLTSYMPNLIIFDFVQIIENFHYLYTLASGLLLFFKELKQIFLSQYL